MESSYQGPLFPHVLPHNGFLVQMGLCIAQAVLPFLGVSMAGGGGLVGGKLVSTGLAPTQHWVILFPPPASLGLPYKNPRWQEPMSAPGRRLLAPSEECFPH